MKVLINTLGDDASRDAYRSALKAHFKDGISDMCGDCQRRYVQNPLRILDCKIDHDSPLMSTAPKMSDYLTQDSKEYFDLVLAGLDALGIPYEVEDTLVRGLDYYTHTVFEIVSMNEAVGAQSTVLAGGRYDGLVEYFGGPEKMSGIGWALGIERLIIAAEAEGIVLGEEQGLDAYVMCLSPSVQIPALQIVTELRAAGYRSECEFMNRSFKAQFKSVDRKHAKTAIIIGEDDIAQGTVNIKQIASKTQEAVKLEDIVSYMDHIFEGDGEHECTCEDGNCTCGHHHE